MSSRAYRAATALAQMAPGISKAMRVLKNRLRSRFPEGKSSHLTEALAAGLGFASQAALRACLTLSPLGKMPFFHVVPFIRRWHALGYDACHSFVWSAAPQLQQPPALFVDLQSTLGALSTVRSKDPACSNLEWGRYLHRQCAQAFGVAHDLGAPAERSAKGPVHRWYVGVDHSACIPGWGAMLEGRFLRFGPGANQLHFLRSLPLTGGGSVQYTSAVVDTPQGTGNREVLLADAELRACVLGWTSTRLPDWNWRWSTDSTLVLYRPTISHSERLQQWEGSFPRWLLENQRHLLKGAGTLRRQIIKELIGCPHVPLQARQFEDFRNDYLMEQKTLLLHSHPDSLEGIYQILFEMWRPPLSGAH